MLFWVFTCLLVVGTFANDNVLSLLAINKATISVPNIDRTEKWYATVLGFSTVSKGDVPQIGGKLLLMEVENTTIQIEFIEPYNPVGGFFRPDPPKHYGTYGMSQFSFFVQNLDLAVQTLQKQDVPILWCFRNKLTSRRMAFFKDLYQNILQIIQVCSCEGDCCPPLPTDCPPV